MAYKLFSLSDDGEIVINKLVVLTIPSFKLLLQRDKGSIGDADGRRKLHAFKELAYIYHVADYNSLPNKNGYDTKEAIKYAILKSGLSKDYTADDLVKQCIRDYQDEQENIAFETINELLQTFRLTKQLVAKIRISLERQLNIGEVTIDSANDMLNKIEFLINSSKKIPTIVKDLKKAITELEIESEDSADETIRGTKDRIPMSADPDRDY